MPAHPTFPDVLLHSDDELAHELGSAVVDRRTVHAWPLSCVQRLALEDGRALAYKSQLPPTVEPEFYDAASTPLLARHRSLGRLGQCRTMVVSWIRSRLLRAVASSPGDMVSRTREVVGLIGDIAGDPPVHLDAGGQGGWNAATRTALEKLETLVGDGRFASVPPSAVDRLLGWCSRPSVLESIATSRLIHGDLRADQVFVTPSGYRVIDWQRPVVAPPDVDLVSTLVAERIDPAPHASPDVIEIFWFLRLHWAVEAQHDVFPDFRGPLFERWTSEALGKILLRP